MKTRRIYDVLIIGAGPAGLMAARELRQHDINFRIIEAKPTIGYPLKCAEITREETFSELFDHTDYPFIKNKISYVSFQIKNTRNRFKKNFFMIDKPQFQQWLAKPIEDKLMLSTEPIELKTKKNSLEIITNNGSLHTKLAILASGTKFKVQKELGLIKKDIELIPCIGGLFKNATLSPDTAHFFYDEDMFIASWCFPKGNNIFNAGAGIILNNERTKRLNLEIAFHQSMKNFGIPLEGRPSFGGSYVTSGPLNQTYSDRLLVCGDSAGQVFAGIGEGIYFSLKAGQLAGRTAISAIKNETFSSGFLKEYESGWEKSFGRQMKAGVIFATVLFFLMRHRLTHSALKMIKPKEIHDMWINGLVSFRIKVFYYFLRLLGGSPKR
jgi:digeranylgeranylglycerophospholipid reductase